MVVVPHVAAGADPLNGGLHCIVYLVTVLEERTFVKVGWGQREESYALLHPPPTERYHMSAWREVSHQEFLPPPTDGF